MIHNSFLRPDVKGKFPVIKYLFSKDFPLLEESLSGLPGELLEAHTPKELTDIFLRSQGGLILFSLSERKDLIEIGSVLKSLKTTLKDVPFKAVIVNFHTGKNLEEKALQMEVQDLISGSISRKALSFKLDFWLRTLGVLTRPKENNFLTLVDIEQELTERKDVEWLNALHIENDIWILKSTSDLKKNEDTWTVKVLGPGILVGEWLQLEGDRWSFQFHGPEKTRFLSGMGNWFFTGDSPPTFLAEEKGWEFKGKSFELYYTHEKEKIEWMKAYGGKILIRRNSPFALIKEDLIKDSFYLERIKAWSLEEVTSMEKLDSFLTINGEFYSCRFDDYFEDEVILQTNRTDIHEIHGEGVFVGFIPKNGKQHLVGVVELLEDGYISLKLNKESSEQMAKFYDSFSQHQELMDDRLKRMKGL